MATAQAPQITLAMSESAGIRFGIEAVARAGGSAFMPSHGDPFPASRARERAHTDCGNVWHALSYWGGLSQDVKATLTMKLEWTYTALNYFDQLDRRDRGRIEHALNHLAVNWNEVSPPQLPQLQMLKGTPERLWVFRASPEYRVILSIRNNHLVVEDIVRRSQIDALNRLSETKAAKVK